MENEMGAIEPNNKNKAATFVLYAILLIVILSLAYRVAYIYLFSNEDDSRLVQETEINPDEYFEDCELKFENCEDDCNLYLFCSDQKYDICRIYDCDGYYGIARKVDGGEMVFVKETKVDTAKVVEKKNECEGNMQVLSNECVDGKTEIVSSVSTNGDCSINGFRVFYKDVGLKNSEFSSLEDEQYLITVNYCGEVDQVVAVGRGGTVIDQDKF